jgi:uncharacterized protein YllA (UPF0747 family)
MNKIFMGLSRDQVAKVNELIKVVNKNDELLEKQDDLLMRKKMTILTYELKIYNDSISCLKYEKVDLNAKI